MACPVQTGVLAEAVGVAGVATIVIGLLAVAEGQEPAAAIVLVTV